MRDDLEQDERLVGIHQDSSNLSVQETPVSSSSHPAATPKQRFRRVLWLSAFALILTLGIVWVSNWDSSYFHLPIWPSQSYFVSQAEKLAGPNGPTQSGELFTAYANLTQSAAKVGQVDVLFETIAKIEKPQTQFIAYWAMYSALVADQRFERAKPALELAFQSITKVGEPRVLSQVAKSGFDRRVEMITRVGCVPKIGMTDIAEILKSAADSQQLDVAFQSVLSVTAHSWRPFFYDAIAFTAANKGLYDIALRSADQIEDPESRYRVYTVITQAAAATNQIEAVLNAIDPSGDPFSKMVIFVASAQILTSQGKTALAKESLTSALKQTRAYSKPEVRQKGYSYIVQQNRTEDDLTLILDYIEANEPAQFQPTCSEQVVLEVAKAGQYEIVLKLLPRLHPQSSLLVLNTTAQSIIKTNRVQEALAASNELTNPVWIIDFHAALARADRNYRNAQKTKLIVESLVAQANKIKTTNPGALAKIPAILEDIAEAGEFEAVLLGLSNLDLSIDDRSRVLSMITSRVRWRQQEKPFFEAVNKLTNLSLQIEVRAVAVSTLLATKYTLDALAQLDALLKQISEIREPVIQIRGYTMLVPYLTLISSPQVYKNILKQTYLLASQLPAGAEQEQIYSDIIKVASKAKYLDGAFESVAQIADPKARERVWIALTRTLAQQEDWEHALLEVGKIPDLQIRFLAYSTIADQIQFEEIRDQGRPRVYKIITSLASGVGQRSRIYADLCQTAASPDDFSVIFQTAEQTLDPEYQKIWTQHKFLVYDATAPVCEGITSPLAQSRQANALVKTVSQFTDASYRKRAWLSLAQAAAQSNTLNSMFEACQSINDSLAYSEAVATIIQLAANHGQSALMDQAINSALTMIAKTPDARTQAKIYSNLALLSVGIANWDTESRVLSQWIQTAAKTDQLLAILDGVNQTTQFYLQELFTEDTSVIDSVARTYAMVMPELAKTHPRALEETLGTASEMVRYNTIWMTKAQSQAYETIAQFANQTHRLEELLAKIPQIPSPTSRVRAYTAIASEKALILAFRELESIAQPSTMALLTNAAKAAANQGFYHTLYENLRKYNHSYSLESLAPVYEAIAPALAKSGQLDVLFASIGKIENPSLRAQNYAAIAPTAQKLGRTEMAKQAIELAIKASQPMTNRQNRYSLYIDIINFACDSDQFQVALAILDTIVAENQETYGPNRTLILAIYKSLAAKAVKANQFPLVLEATQKIKSSELRSFIHAQIAFEAIQANQFNAILKLADEAPNSQTRSMVYNGIVQALARTKQWNLVKPQVNQIADHSAWFSAMVATAFQQNPHQQDFARDILDVTYEMANQITDPVIKLHAYQTIIQSTATMKH